MYHININTKFKILIVMSYNIFGDYMKHFKKWRILYFFIFCFIIGFLTMPLFHGGYFNDLWASFTHIKWYFQILIFIAMFFVTLALHELTHFISFILSGYKNEMIIILFLVFYKKDNKWRFKVDFKLLLLGGGVVFVDLAEIKDEPDFKRANKAMRTSLLAAPLFTLISGVLYLLITLLFFYKNHVLVPTSIYVFIFSMLYTYVSNKETDMIFGDFKAYKRLKNDVNFQNVIISQYANSLYDEKFIEMKEYIKDQNPIKSDLISKSYFIILLDRALFTLDEIDYFCLEKVLYYYNNKMSFSRLVYNTENIDLAQAIIFYLDSLNYKDEAMSLFNILKSSITNSNLNDKAKTYFIKQTKHILKISDETKFLSDIKNIDKGNLFFIMRNVPSVIEAEKVKNAGYKGIKGYLPLIIK